MLVCLWQFWKTARRLLLHYNKHGLLAALEQMKDELFLLGLITLVLSAVEGPLTSTCGMSTSAMACTGSTKMHANGERYRF